MSRIDFWAADSGGCGFYRCKVPGGALAEAGHTVHVDGMLRWQELNDVDVIVGQRVARPEPSSLWQSLARMPVHPKLVYELDDDVWSLAHEERNNPASVPWLAWLDDVERNLACSDAVTVSTESLAEVVSKFTDAPMHVVPNAIPDWVLVAGARIEQRTHPHTLGWSGSRTHDDDWRTDRAWQVVSSWADDRSWELVLAGDEIPAPFEESCAIDPGFGRRIRQVQWIIGWLKYFEHLRSIDVGLAPLARTRFNRSKSDLRCLELAACGVPWIGTDYGPYSEARGGMLTSSAREWRGALTAFAGESRLRSGLRAQGLEWAHTRTIGRVLPLWLDALDL